MPVFGTVYGGWWLPDDIVLNEDSIILSAGVGEDISFDLSIQSKYGCNIFMFDPTKRACVHFKEIEQFYRDSHLNFSGDIQPDYYRKIKDLTPDLSKIKLIEVGLWLNEDELKFYKQSNAKYVSQSLINGMYSEDFTIAKVKRLGEVIKDLGLSGRPIDVFKLDIEGSEIEVLETMIEDGIKPTFLCVEWDYYLKGCDKNGRTKALMKKLSDVGYDLLNDSNWNMTYRLRSSP
jgi:hypothetical protein